LWIPELIVLAIGAVTLVASFVRSETRPYLPSVIIAYFFFLPINASGFGLGSGLPDVWLPGLLVFFTHLALASLLGLITLYALKLRPSTSGMVFSGIMALFFVIMLVLFMEPKTPSADQAGALSTPTNQLPPLPSSTPDLISFPTKTVGPETTSTVLPDSVDFTETVAVALTQVAQTNNAPTPTATQTPAPLVLEITLPATPIPTVTLTIEVEPISGTINANEGGGANLRQTPNGKYLMTLDNGSIVQIYPDFKLLNGITWIHVFVTRNGQRVEGWLLESVVQYATPEPNFEASTPAITPAP